VRLFIAEKPSLARAIAEVLPGPQRRAKDSIMCGDANVVAWCAGHILETAPPEAYAAELKEWRLDHLPIAPKEWKLEVTTPTLLKSIKGLLKDAARVVHAGDPDREGQLLVDEVLHYLGYRGPVDRILVSDLSPEAVRRQLGALEPNTKYARLYESALARQRADWLYGMNMTRLYTLLGRAAGYQGVLSVGRVQTPLLGLIVARDRAIAEFEPIAYFVVTATVQAGGDRTFRARWVPGQSAEPHLDEEKRLLRRELADAVAAHAAGKRGAVTAHTQDKKSEPPPLPYSLADLQMDAGKRLGMSAQQVLDACQSLYETHRLTTYPRSDSSHLPEGHLAQAKDVLAAIGTGAPTLAAAVGQADLTLRSKAWNDKKVTAHHAIIPTPAGQSGAAAKLSSEERGIYELIGRRYLAQFYAPHSYLQTQVELQIAGERFAASGRQITGPGWKALYAGMTEEPVDASSEDTPEDRAVLPPLQVGDPLTAIGIAAAEKHTQPPKPFSDASLIAAMCGIAKFVNNPNIKKILSEADGIGTPATRAAIIETLFERGYVQRVKKTIVSTDTGRALIKSLPEVATTPDMTAVWEVAMRAISDGAQTLDAFLARVNAQLEQLVDQGRALGRISLPAAPSTSSSSSHRAPPKGRAPATPSKRSRRP
jgi:DNA topoisomerase-3